MGSQDFNEPVFVVLPGHYESAASASQSDPNAARTIIRIIGCDNNGYWLDSDGKRYTESDLQYNWVALDTVPTLNTTKKQTAALFRGFKPTPEPTGNGEVLDYTKQYPDIDPGADPDEQEPYQYQSYGPSPVTTLERPSTSLQRPNASIRTRNQIEQESSKFNEIDFLLNKAHIDVLNQQSQENYGISKYKPTVIQLNLEFEIPYDLSKIQQIIELFNLKPIDVINYLYQSVEYPEASIKQKLRNLLIPDVVAVATPMETPRSHLGDDIRSTFEPPKTVLYTHSEGPSDDIATIGISTSGGNSDDIAGISKSTHRAAPSTTPERPLDSLQRPNASKSTEKKKPNFFDF